MIIFSFIVLPNNNEHALKGAKFPFILGIGNVGLVQECFAKYLRIGTAQWNKT